MRTPPGVETKLQRVTGQRSRWGCVCDTWLYPTAPLGTHDPAEIHFHRALLTRTNLVMMNFKDLLKCCVAIDFHSIQRCLRDMDHKPDLGLFSILVESDSNKFGLDGNFLKVLLRKL